MNDTASKKPNEGKLVEMLPSIKEDRMISEVRRASSSSPIDAGSPVSSESESVAKREPMSEDERKENGRKSVF